MTEHDVSDAVRDRAWEVIAIVRDECPRDPKDASTDDIVTALAEAGLLVPTLADAEWCNCSTQVASMGPWHPKGDVTCVHRATGGAQ